MSARRAPGLVWLAILVSLLAACRLNDLEPILRPPRLATQTAQAQQAAAPPPTPTPAPAASLTPAPTPAGGVPITRVNPNLTVWVDETSDAHIAALRRLGEAFTAATAIQVEFVFIEASLLPELMSTAALSQTLPDVVLHPLEFSLRWSQAGILNPEAAAQAVAALGAETFAPGALSLAALPDGRPAALPSDGWQQLLLYRRDWFAAAGLPAPDNFQRILAGAAAFYNLENVTSGFVGATDADSRATQRIFEHLAAANGCALIDAKGELRLLEPVCLQALKFYYKLVFNYSPPGIQTDVSAIKAYLTGRTAMIMTTPRVLPALAGLDAGFPPGCPECAADPAYLAQQTGFETQISGYITTGVSANFSQINLLGITTAAEPAEALAFVTYWFNDGYVTWLGVEPERKAPLRLGSAENPRAFLDAWRALPLTGSDKSLSDLYGAALADQLNAGLATAPRWGFAQGQGALMGDIYAENVLSPLLQRLLSGYMNPSETLVEAYLDVVKFIPDYPYFPETLPTPDRSGG